MSVYIMHKIYLVNKISLIDELNYVSSSNTTISGSLYFVKKYYDVQNELSFMIPDLANIIMTYVNDEFEISYVVSRHHSGHTEIFFKILCSIWFVNYNFNFSLYRVEHNELRFNIYVSKNNNILKASEEFFQTDVVNDCEYESYIDNFNSVIYNYALQCGIKLHSITSDIEQEELHLKSKDNWIPLMFVSNLGRIYTKSKRQLRNIIIILKLIDSILSKN